MSSYKKIRLLIPFFSILLACHQPAPAPNTALKALEWIDLSYSFDSTTLYWPNNLTGFQKNTEAEGETAAGFYYASYAVCAPEHGGTHLDAPVHFAKGALTADAIPLSALTGMGVVIDVSTNALKNRDYLISIADIEAWEKTYGQIPADAIVLFRTGYGKFYPDRLSYFGTATLGVDAIAALHFPGIAPEAAAWLLKNRKVKALGLDTPSIDYGQSKDFKTHQIWMGANKPAFENVANLDKLPATNIYIVALPMKIGGGSGGPLRIIAGVGEGLE